MTKTDDLGRLELPEMTVALNIVEQLSKEATKGKVLQMPLWPADLVGTPNVILRTALFGLMEPVKSDNRDKVDKKLVASAGGPKEQIKVWFSGHLFNQSDLDYFEAILQFSGESSTEYVTLDDDSKMMVATAYSILKRVGRTDNSRSYNSLAESMLRLREGSIRIVITRVGVPAAPGFAGIPPINLDIGGPLILHGKEGGSKGRHLFAINPLLKPLFKPGLYSLVNFPLRVSLRKDLSKWLLGFYSSHAQPVAHSLDKLHELCGSGMKNKTLWRNAVTRAHDELVGCGFLTSYALDKFSNVRVVRSPEHVTRNQSKILAVKAEAKLKKESLPPTPAPPDFASI